MIKYYVKNEWNYYVIFWEEGSSPWWHWRNREKIFALFGECSITITIYKYSFAHEKSLKISLTLNPFHCQGFLGWSLTWTKGVKVSISYFYKGPIIGIPSMFQYVPKYIWSKQISYLETLRSSARVILSVGAETLRSKLTFRRLVFFFLPMLENSG